MNAAKLDWITVQGFRSIISIEKLPVRAMSVLIGSNGSGKSNFIGALSFLHAIREERLREYVAAAGGAERLLHFGSKHTSEIVFGAGCGDGQWEYTLKLSPTADDGLFVSTEEVRLFDRIYRVPPRQGQREAGISGGESRHVAGWLREALIGWRLYHVHDTSASSPMRKTARISDNEFLRPDGSNLAPILYYLRELRGESYETIRRTVQLVAPFFDDFQLRPVRLNPDDIKLEWRHRGSDQYFDVSSLSDGTLRFMVLATLFLQPEEMRPSLILVDEPELGLHPSAIGVLAGLMRQASLRSSVMVSTQSALLLDHLQPEDVLVTERVDQGTQVARLDRGKLRQWLEHYSLGELWEKNELGGRPVRG